MTHLGFPDQEAVLDALRAWDAAEEWPSGAHAIIVLMGASALPFYLGRSARSTEDIDALLRTSDALPDRLRQIAERLGLSFRAEGVAWLPAGWEERARWSPARFEHLTVGWLDPIDWIVSKLGRWQKQDPEDALSVARLVDAVELRRRVLNALPDYVGDPRWIAWAWRDLAEALGLPQEMWRLDRPQDE
ncbi:conserved protein of unknown function [Candidatus Hydrogenisulfobacillus filiaventi]|uniref:DUF6036 domain-containing protein n=1 Tax=Candidatus Hydrogenisulfobacillus filiaventi TaxID=2707344 RepID=A0A6F8ZCB4_9FIRM|nr:DUF6036 family nucleotidyltransferase [Bacillota bacterium]CAB1127571.1 conserved protein of unknown function [Candidatus Hydrogenisulfobacillus filiaventi]